MSLPNREPPPLEGEQPPSGQGLEARRPAVPLRAAASPRNPPCPACGEPLFPWAEAPGAVALRCENCGLGVAREGADRSTLVRAMEDERLPNAASLQAAIGGDSWWALDGANDLLATREAISLVEPRADRRAAADIAGMWQTLLNLFTFGHNAGLCGRHRGRRWPARMRWQRAMDGCVTVLGALPLLGVAALLELAAAAFRRGGWVRQA